MIYPLAASIDYSTHLTKLLISKREWIIENIYILMYIYINFYYNFNYII